MTEEEEFEFELARMEMERERNREVDPSILSRPESVPSHMRHQSALIPAAAQALGVDPSSVRMGGTPALTRAATGASADIPEERLKFYRRRDPGGRYRLVAHPKTGERYVVGVTSEGQAVVPNEPGFDLGDVAQFLGAESAPTTAAMAAVGATPPPWGLLTGPLAYGGTKALQEGAQTLLGTQAESLPQVANRIGMETGMELAGAGLGGLTQKLGQTARGTVFGGVPESMAQDVRNIEAARGEGMGLRSMLPWQLRDSPIWASAARQRENIVGGRPERLARQRDVIAREDLPRLRVRGREETEDTLRAMAEDRRMEIYDEAPSARDFESAGIDLNQTFRRVYSRSNKELRDLYSEVDKAQALEQPQFNLAKAKEKAPDLGIFGYGEERQRMAGALKALEGPVTVKDVNRWVNVAEPEGKVRKALALLSELDDTQVDYKVIQRLRSIVGGAIKTFKSGTSENMTSGQAKAVYDLFTDVLKNPTNKVDTPRYLETFDTATEAARNQFRWLEDQQIKSALRKEDTPVALFQQVASNPSRLTTQARSLIDNYTPERRTRTKDSILGAVFLERGDNIGPYLRKQYEKDPGLYNWLAGSPTQARNLLRTAESLSEIKGSVWDDVLKNKGEILDQQKSVLISQAKTPRSSQRFAATLTPEQRKVMEQSVLDSLMEGVEGTQKETGGRSIDYGRYLKNKEEAQDRGWMDVFVTPRTRTRLEGLESYLRLTEERSTGATLQQGAMGSQIDEPAKWGGLASAFMAARPMAWILANDRLGDRMYRNILSGVEAPGTRAGQNFGLILSSMINEAQDLDMIRELDLPSLKNQEESAE